jgi:hypothetical protein
MATTLIYNNIVLDKALTLAYHKNAVYDGPNYIYTTHRIRVQGEFNPARWAYTSGGNALQNQPPGRTPDTMPAVTENAIRDALMRPRGKLVFLNGNFEQLVSPPGIQALPVQLDGAGQLTVDKNLGPVTITDATDGPFPVDAQIVRIIGTKTFIVTFTIETHINETYRYAGSRGTRASPILSNIWEVSESHDRDFRATRSFRGRAVFHGGVLKARGHIADQYRASVVPMAAEGFAREQEEFTLAPDGLTLSYQIRDVEQHSQLTERATRVGATRIEAVQTYTTKQPSAADAIGEVLLGTMGGASSAFTTRGLGGGSLGAITSFAGALGQVAMNNVAQVVGSVTVKVWGDRHSNRADLHKIAITAVRYPIAYIESIPHALTITIGHNLIDRAVEVRADYAAARQSARQIVDEGQDILWLTNPILMSRFIWNVGVIPEQYPPPPINQFPQLVQSGRFLVNDYVNQPAPRPPEWPYGNSPFFLTNPTWVEWYNLPPGSVNNKWGRAVRTATRPQARSAFNNSPNQNQRVVGISPSPGGQQEQPATVAPVDEQQALVFFGPPVVVQPNA